jgi:uncharacterized protein YyaL (SSP411 family)
MESHRGRRNKLWKEKSPYLLQHADNPVHWHPWGREAFETARRENKPVFLSIGYSTCHWCHVMAHESFEDKGVADILNRDFVAIKVDREERPDIDHVYMTVCQSLTGSGGWPLSVFLTPEGKPFFAGTYFPRETRSGLIGMMDLLPKISRLWQSKGRDLSTSSDKVVSMLRRESSVQADRGPDRGLLDACFTSLSRGFDPEYGGFGQAPKFPTPHQLLFLLRYWKRTKNPAALFMVEKTLKMMRAGGIFDHAGLGFHRYSTDREWKVPHFEKMLYDQAMLALAFLEAFQAAKDGFYAETAREILSYVMLEMTATDGGFYSAQDADSEGAEGKYYLWTADELAKALDAEDTRLASGIFNISRQGNFPEAAGYKPGGNILYMARPLEELANETGITYESLRKRLEHIRKRLYALRNERVRPLKDDKVLTDWNGLMIAAFARAGLVLGEETYTGIAARAADFILAKMSASAGAGKITLLHRSRGGHAAIDGMLNDYAFMAWGLIELYSSTFDPGYLKTALEINEALLEHFRDDAEGGFHFTPDFGEKLILRRKEVHDGAIPSGNSVALMNLLRLARLTGDARLEAEAARTAAAFAGQVRQYPCAFCFYLCAVDFLIGPSFEIVIAGEADSPDTSAMLDALRGIYLPQSVVLFRPAGRGSPILDAIAPFTSGMKPQDGRAAAYVCTNRTCAAPVADPGKLADLLS